MRCCCAGESGVQKADSTPPTAVSSKLDLSKEAKDGDHGHGPGGPASPPKAGASPFSKEAGTHGSEHGGVDSGPHHSSDEGHHPPAFKQSGRKSFQRSTVDNVKPVNSMVNMIRWVDVILGQAMGKTGC